MPSSHGRSYEDYLGYAATTGTEDGDALDLTEESRLNQQQQRQRSIRTHHETDAAVPAVMSTPSSKKQQHQTAALSPFSPFLRKKKNKRQRPTTSSLTWENYPDDTAVSLASCRRVSVVVLVGKASSTASRSTEAAAEESSRVCLFPLHTEGPNSPVVSILSRSHCRESHRLWRSIAFRSSHGDVSHGGTVGTYIQ